VQYYRVNAVAETGTGVNEAPVAKLNEQVHSLFPIAAGNRATMRAGTMRTPPRFCCSNCAPLRGTPGAKSGTRLRDAIAAFSHKYMHTAHELNGPMLAHATSTTSELLASLPPARCYCIFTPMVPGDPHWGIRANEAVKRHATRLHSQISNTWSRRECSSPY
jgi:hypothetical protein